MRRNFIKNKKGSLLDLFFIAAILLFFGMILLFGFKITTEFNGQVQSMSEIPAEGKAASTELLSYYPGVMDHTFLLLAIGLAIVTLVLASLVRVHPMFIAFYFIGLIIVIFYCGVLSNIYQELASNALLLALADQLVFTSHILAYLPFIVGIIGFLLMIIMYKTWSNEQ